MVFVESQNPPQTQRGRQRWSKLVQRRAMPGQVFELLGLVTLAGFAGVGGIVLFTAGIEAIEHSAFVGILVLCFSLVLFVTAASVGGWGVLEWHRAERAAPPVESTARDAEGRIKSLREAFRQPVAIQLMVKVAFFCSTLNLGVEIFYLRRCHRIFLISTPEGPPDPHYCDNLAWSAHGINSINPHTRTFLTEMPGTVRAPPDYTADYRQRAPRSSRAVFDSQWRGVFLLRRLWRSGFSARSSRTARSSGPSSARSGTTHSLAVRPDQHCPRRAPPARRAAPRVSVAAARADQLVCDCSALPSMGGAAGQQAARRRFHSPLGDW